MQFVTNSRGMALRGIVASLASSKVMSNLLGFPALMRMRVLMRRAAITRCFVGWRAGNEGLGIGGKVTVNILRDHQTAPHDLVMARESANVFIIAGNRRSREFERLTFAGLKQARGGQNSG